MQGRSGHPKVQRGNCSLWVGVEKHDIDRETTKRTNNASRMLKTTVHLAPDQLSSVDYLQSCLSTMHHLGEATPIGRGKHEIRIRKN